MSKINLISTSLCLPLMEGSCSSKKRKMSQTIDNQAGDGILQPGGKYYLCRNQIFADPELIDFVRDIRHIGGVNMHTLLETYDIQVVSLPSSQEQDLTRRDNHAGRPVC